MTSLTIEKIVEHENGSATLTIDMDNEMLQSLLQHAVIDLLKKEVEAEENHDKKRGITTKKEESRQKNERIELVKKWLDDTDSVTSEELETNSKYAAADACRAEQLVQVALIDPAQAVAAAAAAAAAATSTTVASSCAHAAAQYAAYVSRSEGTIKPSWIQHVQSYIDRYDGIINE